MMKRLLILLSIPLGHAACGDGRAESGTTVDTVVPIDTALARFRQGLEEPAELEPAAMSLDDLIGRVVGGLERNDTAGLAALAITRSEFAYLYYPTVPEARPPYELAPGLFWFMIEGNSTRGLRTALAERGGAPLQYVGYRCTGEPRHQGENTIWPLCVVRRLQAPGDTVEERLFGPILQRGGRFKLVTFANKL
jgi:hypothetical protein